MHGIGETNPLGGRARREGIREQDHSPTNDSPKYLGDLDDDLIVRFADAVDGEVGALAVEGLALVVEGADGLALFDDYAAGVEICNPLLDLSL